MTDRHNSMDKSHLSFLSERSKIQKPTYYMIALVCHSVESKTMAMEDRSVVARVRVWRKVSQQRVSTRTCFRGDGAVL